MTKPEMEAEVARLLAERARLARMKLELPPDKRALLERLLQRLGWVGWKMNRKADVASVKRYAVRPEAGDELVPLYRGDLKKIGTFSLDKADPMALFGQGLYFSDSSRLAGDYTGKGGKDLSYNYGKVTRQEAEDSHVRRIARGLYDSYGVRNPPPEVEAELIPQAAAEWEKRKAAGWRVRKNMMGETVVSPPSRVGYKSRVMFPKRVLSSTLDAEQEIPEDVFGVLYDALVRHGDGGTAKEMAAYVRQRERDEDGFRPSFRELWGSIGRGSPIHNPQGRVYLRRALRDLGYTGIRYAGGLTMGGNKHTAYVFWDEQGIKNLPRNTRKMPHKFARLTLGPSRPFRGPFGEAMLEHDYADEAGNTLGVLRLQPRNDGRHLHVHWVGPADAKAGEAANTVGPEAVRSLVPQIKAAYPQAEFISGVRAGGFRTGGREGERVVRALQRIREKYARPKELLEGGKGDGKPDSWFDRRQLLAGIRVEMEHTRDWRVAREIARDHLTEDADYYTKLRRAKLARRGGKPVRYAKVDGDVAAHPLVQGFPLETALRHLANDPDNPSNIRDIAVIALTGKTKDEKAPRPEGRPDALWALNDALQDANHPAADWYNWLSAADKVVTDSHVYKSLKHLGDAVRHESRRINPADHDLPDNFWPWTPEHWALQATGNRVARQWVRQHVRQHHPEVTDAQVDESLKRHALRARRHWYRLNGLPQTPELHGDLGPAPAEESPYYDEHRAARYARLKKLAEKFRRKDGVRRYAQGKPSGQPWGTEYLWPSEQTVAAGWTGKTRAEHEKDVKASLAGAPRTSPGTGEMKALAGVGEGAHGEYATTYGTLGKLYKDPVDALMWVHANAILSPRTGWREHTAAATRAVRLWVRAGRPTDVKKLGGLFGTVARNPETGGVSLVHAAGMAGTPQYWGQKAAKLIGLFNRSLSVREFRPDLVATTGIGKTPNFGGAFVDPRSVPIDTHMAQITIPGTLKGLLKAVAGAGGGGHRAFRELRDAQERLASDANAGITYKALLSHAAAEMGIEPREMQERVWAGILGVAVAKHLGATDARSILRSLNHYAVSRGWDVHDVLLDPAVLNDIEETTGTDKRRIARTIQGARRHRLRGVSAKPIGTGSIDQGALEAVASRVAGHVPPGAEPILQELLNPTRRSRLKALVKKYAQSRTDFIDALRRVRSSSHDALRKAAHTLAQKFGLAPADVVDAVYDAPHGSTPGVASAVYGPASPELVRAAAAWLGLTANSPGVAVFHPRPGGPDTLYRFRQRGAGYDIREKLDRHGITERVLVPHSQGFDVLVPDQGNRFSRNVRSYVATHGLQLQASPGHFRAVGDADQSQARDKYRNVAARPFCRVKHRST